MIVAAIVIAFLLDQIRPAHPAEALSSLPRRWIGAVIDFVDAGGPSHGWMAWGLAVALPALCAGLISGLCHWIVGWPAQLAWSIAVLYFTLGFRQFSHHATAIGKSLAEGDEAGAAEQLRLWQQEQGGVGCDFDKYLWARKYTTDSVARMAIAYAVLLAHRWVFGVLLWYCLFSLVGLAPAAGAIFYRYAEFASRLTRETEPRVSQTDSPALFAAMQSAWFIIDWLPVRATAIMFAAVGNFEDAIAGWRQIKLTRASLKGPEHNDALLLAAASGALGISLERATASQGSPNAQTQPTASASARASHGPQNEIAAKDPTQWQNAIQTQSQEGPGANKDANADAIKDASKDASKDAEADANPDALSIQSSALAATAGEIRTRVQLPPHSPAKTPDEAVHEHSPVESSVEPAQAPLEVTSPSGLDRVADTPTRPALEALDQGGGPQETQIEAQIETRSAHDSAPTQEPQGPQEPQIPQEAPSAQDRKSALTPERLNAPSDPALGPNEGSALLPEANTEANTGANTVAKSVINAVVNAGAHAREYTQANAQAITQALTKSVPQAVTQAVSQAIALAHSPADHATQGPEKGADAGAVSGTDQPPSGPQKGAQSESSTPPDALGPALLPPDLEPHASGAFAPPEQSASASSAIDAAHFAQVAGLLWRGVALWLLLLVLLSLAHILR